MEFFTTVAIGAIAGLHAACYGAYKDSPHEKFKWARFIREILIAATVAAIVWLFFPKVLLTTRLLVFLVILAWSRILTEGYKLFIRVEPQSGYLIPSQVHVFRRIVKNKLTRLLLGCLVAGGLALFSYLTVAVSWILNGQMLGATIGLIAGIATGLGGGYKDGLFEGFSVFKFFRSPSVGLLAGAALAFINPIHTHTPILLFFGSIGLERMIVECYKGFLKTGYSPGKFKHPVAPYPENYSKRKFLLIPYISTWLFFFFLVSSNLP